MGNHPNGCGCPSCYEDRQLADVKQVWLTGEERGTLVRLLENYRRAGGAISNVGGLESLISKLEARRG